MNLVLVGDVDGEDYAVVVGDGPTLSLLLLLFVVCPGFHAVFIVIGI